MSAMKRAKAGRKSITGGSGASPVLLVRVPAVLLRALKARAAREGVTVSDVVRTLLEKGLAKER